MKRIFNPGTLCFLFLMAACSGVKTEKWPNGNIKSEISWHGGQRNGPAKYWYEDGTLQMECAYQNNLLDGRLSRYYQNGIKKEQQDYKNDTLNGPAFVWDRSGNLTIESNYAKGTYHGNYREFYPNRQIRIEGIYVKGIIDGQWLYFNESGQVIGKGNFNLGEGVQESFYPENGRIKSRTPYKNNVKEGTETEYAPDGRVLNVKIFSGGKLITVNTAPDS